ncbi:MAG: 4-(cytidine 5'-diphospho)-2-C-methyl-D-erythritol kinase [Ruminococcus sp.]|nr:4-(cytidine 5'-diphospho)-2-C-methyl-D-erythritol kinase [Ruminococcus sp.]
MKLKSAAKINLALDVTGRRSDGYHEIESVFQTVGIYDEITVKLTESGIGLICESDGTFPCDDIPCDERNIAYKAARKFLDENGLEIGCRICIKKGIPSQAGMGGGSSNAAAVLFCLEKLTGKVFSSPEKIGADVAFYLCGGTAYVAGIGEKITKIADYSGKILVIAKGNEGVSTNEAYKAIDELENYSPLDIKNLVRAIEKKEDISKYIGNIFEKAVELSEVADIKRKMLASGAESACMTGSGSAVFGIFSDLESARRCNEILAGNSVFSRICETVPESFVILEQL